MNAQTTYLHHSPPPLEGTTSSRGRRAEQLQFSHNPYYSSVRTTATEGTIDAGTDIFPFVTSAGENLSVYMWAVQASLDIYSNLDKTCSKFHIQYLFKNVCPAHQDRLSNAALHSHESTIKVTCDIDRVTVT